MKTAIRIILIVAACLVTLGVLTLVGALAIGGWSFAAVQPEYETVTYDVAEPFSVIRVDVDVDDVTFRLAADGRCRVEVDEEKNVAHNVAVKNDTLSITLEDEREWYERWTFFAVESPKMTVYLPENTYDALTLKTDTGDVTLPGDFTFGALDVTVSTGDIVCRAICEGEARFHASTGGVTVADTTLGALTLSQSTGRAQIRSVACAGAVSLKASTGRTTVTDLTCRSLVSDGSTGNVTLDGVLVTEKMTVERSTGNIELKGCDAAELFLKTSTGDVSGTLLSPKIFFADTSTGHVDVPRSTTGGPCEIKTSTGDIEITVR